MTTLSWSDHPGPALIAASQDDTYLITWDQDAVVLARIPDGTASTTMAAIEAALTAVRIPAESGTRDRAIVLLKHMAQAYESGVGVPGQPAWQLVREFRPGAGAMGHISLGEWHERGHTDPGAGLGDVPDPGTAT